MRTRLKIKTALLGLSAVAIIVRGRSNPRRTYRRHAALDGSPRRGTPEYDEFMAKRAQEAARPKTEQPK